MWMIYPFSVGTLTFVRTIETFVESLCHRTRTIRSSGSFLFLWLGRLGRVASSSHLINKLNKASLKRRKFCCLDTWQALKTSLSRISATSGLRTWLCLNGRNCCYGYQKHVFESVSETDLEFFRSGIQSLATLTHLAAQKPDRTPATQSVYSLLRTDAEIQNAVTTKPYVK
jgi:hypothetical protein